MLRLVERIFCDMLIKMESGKILFTLDDGKVRQLTGGMVNRFRYCGHTSRKVAGKRAIIKAEINGFTPGIGRRPPSRLMDGQTAKRFKGLAAFCLILGRFFLKIEIGGKPFCGFSALITC